MATLEYSLFVDTKKIVIIQPRSRNAMQISVWDYYGEEQQVFRES